MTNKNDNSKIHQTSSELNVLRQKNEWLIRVLLVLISVTLSSLITSIIIKGAGSTTFTTKLEFASTLSSIILSVIAIIYTLIGNKSTELTHYKIIEATEIMQDSNQTLSNLNEKIMDIAKKIENSDVDSIIQSVNNALENHFRFSKELKNQQYLRYIANKIEEMSSDNNDGNLTNQTFLDFKKNEEINLLGEIAKKIMEFNGTDLGLFYYKLALYLFYLANIKDGNPFDFFDYMVKNNDNTFISKFCNIKDDEITNDFFTFYKRQIQSIHIVLLQLNIIQKRNKTYIFPDDIREKVILRIKPIENGNSAEAISHLNNLVNEYSKTLSVSE